MPKSNTQTKPTEPTKDQAPSNRQLFSDTNVTMKSGHCVKDAELVGDGKYVKLRFAANKQYQHGDGDIQTNTNYFDALISHHLKEAFELAQGFKKGDWIYLKGEDSTKSFDTPEGFKKTACTIFAYHVALKKEKVASNSQNQHETTHSAAPA